MSEKIAEVQNIDNKITNAIEFRKHKDDKTVLDHIAIKALEGTRQRLKRIAKILNVEHYDLVFIGQVGTGKTTAICHLFGLTEEYKSSIKLSNGKTKSVTKVRELLSTGSGQTTICEVIIKPSSQTYIEIEPYDRQSLEELIKEFTLYIWLREYPRDNDDGAQPPPTELMRAIRNTIDLNVFTTKDDGRTDQAIEFVKKYSKDQFDDFQNDILQRAKLDERIVTKTYPELANETDQSEERSWIRKTFERLNLAKLPNFSVPKKIFVYVSSNVFKFDDEFFSIGAVIDTKGMDVGQTREDLDNYIRDNDGAICLFSEKFPPAPTNVADLIERHLVSRDIGTKFVLFVMPHKGEPEKVVGKDGPVGDHGEGIELRRSTIEAAFTSRKIDFLSTNILFYDALECYLADGRYDPDYDEDDIVLQRRRIFAELKEMISWREEFLWKEVQVLKANFEDINRDDYGLSSHDKILLDEAKEKLKGYRHLNFVTSENFIHEYIGLWASSLRHFMTLRATNNRFGRYEPRNIDIYYDAVPIAEKLASQVMSKFKKEIINIIKNVETNGSSDLRLLMQTLEMQLTFDYQTVIRETGEKIRELLEFGILSPQSLDNEFWRYVIERWGQGPGYKDDVLSMYADEIEEVNGYLRNNVEKIWEKHFLDKILNFLG